MKVIIEVENIGNIATFVMAFLCFFKKIRYKKLINLYNIALVYKE